MLACTIPLLNFCLSVCTIGSEIGLRSSAWDEASALLVMITSTDTCHHDRGATSRAKRATQPPSYLGADEPGNVAPAAAVRAASGPGAAAEVVG